MAEFDLNPAMSSSSLPRLRDGSAAVIGDAGPRYYRPELDILRFFAFFLVFSSHVAGPGTPIDWDKSHLPHFVVSAIASFMTSGMFGVDLFFALSSFLITTLLQMERERTGHLDIPSYYKRRILRIWPLYFAFLLIIEPVLRFLIPGQHLPVKYTAAFLLLAGNWACVLWGYPFSVAAPLWSVSMEEQFYIAWPWITRRWGESLLTVGLVLLVVSFVTRAVLVATGAVHPQIWNNTFARLDPIAYGAMLAVIVKRKPLALSGLARGVLFASALALLIELGHIGGEAFGLKSLFTLPMGAIAVTCLLVATLDVQLKPTLPVRGLVYLGRISYGLYVLHESFLAFFHVTSTGDPWHRLLRTLAALAGTIAAAAISYRFLEQPFLRLKERFAHVRSRPVAAATN